jgi:tetratricopeptide (TPR) repeat protein
VLVDVVMSEVAKTVTASAASAGLTGLGQLWRLIRNKADQEPDGLPAGLAALNDFLVRRAREDPEWADEVARELAARLASSGTAEGPAGMYPPPTPFCDRDTLRTEGPERGIWVYAGPPGSGKTALVRQLAADRSGVFPVHQCQVDLDLFRDGDFPLLGEAKRHVLRQLGIASIAGAEPELSQQYLSVGLHRRVLLVLDNVLGAAEVDALAPGWPDALVLVTTRRLTAELRGRFTWRELGGLDDAGATEMLALHCRLPELPAAEPAATTELLARFGRQPWAIQLLGGILAFRAGEDRPVAGLVAEFAADGVTSTHRELLARTVARLSGQARADFPVLAAHPRGDFAVDSAAALLGRPVARSSVEELREIGLIEALPTGRYLMSWSVRRYAEDLPDRPDVESALDRLLDFYAEHAVAADLANGSERMRYYTPLATRPWDLGKDRIEWLAAEAENLVALAERAFLRCRFERAGQLCAGLEILSLHRQGWYGVCAQGFEWGARAAEQQPDAAALAARQHALCGRAHAMLHQFDRARAELDAAWQAARTIDDPRLESSLWEFEGRLAEEQAGYQSVPNWTPAIDALERAVGIDRRIGHRRAFGLHARMLANVLAKEGQPEAALTWLTEALANTEDSEHRNRSRLHAVSAKVQVIMGNVPAARADLAQALTLAGTANAATYAEELADLEAEIEFREGRVGEARSRWGALAQDCVNIGHPRAELYLKKLSWDVPPGR